MSETEINLLLLFTFFLLWFVSSGVWLVYYLRGKWFLVFLLFFIQRIEGSCPWFFWLALDVVYVRPDAENENTVGFFFRDLCALAVYSRTLERMLSSNTRMLFVFEH